MSLAPDPSSSGLPPLPRPGPDPLPWPETSAWPGTLRGLGIALALGLILYLALRVWWRWRSRSRIRTSSFVPAMPPPGAGMEELATAVRAAIVARLGGSWSARTTEEMAADATALQGAFGDDVSARLLAFLIAADRARFAGRNEPAEDWRAVVAEVLAGARSITSGR